MIPVQLEEAASNLRRKQAHNQDGDDAEIDLADLQVLLYSSRQFGPSAIRELTVRIDPPLQPGIAYLTSQPMLTVEIALRTCGL